jgi:hypothetical protein
MRFSRRWSCVLLGAFASCLAASPASAARPVEGYRSPDSSVGCVLYQNFDSAGNAVKCGRRGSKRGLLLTSSGAAFSAKWAWPAKSLGTLFFKAQYNQKLFLYGGTAKLQGDASILRCVFKRGAGVRCTNRGGYAVVVSRTGSRKVLPRCSVGVPGDFCSSASDAAVCAPVTSRFQFFPNGGYATYASELRLRGIACKFARRLLRECGRSVYPPAGWSGMDLHRRDKEGRSLFSLRSRDRRVYFRAANDSIVPCASDLYPRRLQGISREALTLSPNHLGPTVIGMSLRAAERASGLDLRSSGSCAKSFARPGITVVVTGDRASGAVSQLLVTDPRIPTEAGLRVGDSIDDLQRVYGSKLQQASAPGATSPFFVVPADDEKFEYGFRTDRGVVNLMVGGPRGATQAAAYCD